MAKRGGRSESEQRQEQHQEECHLHAPWPAHEQRGMGMSHRRAEMFAVQAGGARIRCLGKW